MVPERAHAVAVTRHAAMQVMGRPLEHRQHAVAIGNSSPLGLLPAIEWLVQISRSAATSPGIG
jgi:hypothetical protein